MGKYKYILIVFVLGIVTWGVLAFVNKAIYVSQVINVERYRSCTISKCIDDLEKIKLRDRDDMIQLFSSFISKRVRKTMPWEKDFRTYYRITTDDNNIVIYNNEYLVVEEDNIEVFYKFLSPIEPKFLDRYFIN